MHLGMGLRYLAHAGLHRWTGDPDHGRKARKLKLFLGQDRPHEPATQVSV